MKTNIQIRHSQRAKSLQLKVTPIGDVIVVVPKRYRHANIEYFLNEHQSWITERVDAVRKKRALQPALDSLRPERIELPAIDKVFTVDYVSRSRNTLRQEGDRLEIACLEDLNTPQLLQSWLQRTAKQYLVDFLDRQSHQTGLRYSRVTIRGQKTRWGSCTSKGNISLNRNLLFLQPQAVDYLMLHELCHTRHLNHSLNYWDLVKSFEPEFRVFEKQLNEGFRHVPMWAVKR